MLSLVNQESSPQQSWDLTCLTVRFFHRSNLTTQNCRSNSPPVTLFVRYLKHSHSVLCWTWVMYWHFLCRSLLCFACLVVHAEASLLLEEAWACEARTRCRRPCGESPYCCTQATLYGGSFPLHRLENLRGNRCSAPIRPGAGALRPDRRPHSQPTLFNIRLSPSTTKQSQWACQFASTFA